MKSNLEATLLLLIRANGLPEPEQEYRFAPPNRSRADFAYPEKRLLIEVEGGTYSGGRHVRGKGYENDCRKYNRATLDNWRLLRFTGAMIEDGTAIEQIREAICQVMNYQ